MAIYGLKSSLLNQTVNCKARGLHKRGNLLRHVSRWYIGKNFRWINGAVQLNCMSKIDIVKIKQQR